MLSSNVLVRPHYNFIGEQRDHPKQIHISKIKTLNQIWQMSKRQTDTMNINTEAKEVFASDSFFFVRWISANVWTDDNRK